MATGDRRSPTWKVIAVSAVGALGVLSWWGYTDTQAKIKDLTVVKADKETVDRMYDDVKDIKSLLMTHVIDSGGRIPKKKDTEWQP